MEKKLVSALVIISFAFYSLYQRVLGVTVTTVLPSKNTIPQANVPSSLPTTAPTSTPTPSQSASTLPPQAPADTPTPTPVPASGYKDGAYTGDPADAFYGTIQVQAIISGGRITDVKFLQYPNDRSTSIYINSQADPMLTQEAIQAQNANVDVISGATDSSNAFVQSLQSALSQAKR